MSYVRVAAMCQWTSPTGYLAPPRPPAICQYKDLLPPCLFFWEKWLVVLIGMLILPNYGHLIPCLYTIVCSWILIFHTCNFARKGQQTHLNIRRLQFGVRFLCDFTNICSETLVLKQKVDLMWSTNERWRYHRKCMVHLTL